MISKRVEDSVLPKPFHEQFPYAVSWETKQGKQKHTNFAYFSYDDQRSDYIKRTLKGIKGVKRFKTEPRTN